MTSFLIKHRENAGTLVWYPSCLSSLRSPLEGDIYDIPNRYPLYKVYMGLIIKGTISRGPHHFPHDFRMASFQLHWLLSKVDVIAQRAAIGKQIPEVSAALEEWSFCSRMDG